jgi:TPR repeat protein
MSAEPTQGRRWMRQTSSTRTRRRAIPVDSVSGVLGRWFLTATVAIAALFGVGELPLPGNVGASENRAETTSFDSRFEAESSKIIQPAETVTTGIATNEVVGDAVRQLDRDEIAVLRRRGEEFILVGDVTAARLLLRRAAEARDARAALALGAIHDPIVLEKLGVLGVAADTATARIWYEKAKEFGSAEAPHLLEVLADRGPLTHLRDECETIVRSFAGPTLGRGGAGRRAKPPL